MECHESIPLKYKRECRPNYSYKFKGIGKWDL